MIHPFRGIWPVIGAGAWIEESAQVIGEVFLGEDASVWYTAVLRGDVGAIRVGARSNIQDGCVIHATHGLSETTVGDDVTVGHRAILHGCKVGDRALIGMGATILDNAEIGEECLVGANSLVTQGAKFPPRTMILGSPAKVKRELTETEVAVIRASAAHYVEQMRAHRESRTSPVP